MLNESAKTWLNDYDKQEDALYTTDMRSAAKIIRGLLSENAELNKFLKHARDDKKIRLGEIEVLEKRNENLRGMIAHLQEQCDRLRKAVAHKEMP